MRFERVSTSGRNVSGRTTPRTGGQPGMQPAGQALYRSARSASRTSRLRGASVLDRSGLSLLGVALVFMSSALADDFEVIDQPLPNGDFSQGLAEWTVEASPDSSTPAGSVTVVNGTARIAKGGAFLAGLSHGFAAPEDLVALRLTIAEMPQFGSTGDFIPEAFDINLTGQNGFSRVASFRPGASAAANAAPVPAGFNLAPGVTLEGQTLRIELDGIDAGEPLVFSATLVGASSDTPATVAIDDVVLEILRKQQPPDPPGPERVDACELFRDGFEAELGLGSVPRCPLGQVGDTGIIACAGGFGPDCPAPGLPGQDAEFGRDALAQAGELEKFDGGPAGFDYTRLDANGDALPQSAEMWSCVLDSYTGLVWEVKTDDPLGPSHHGHTYTWYEPDGSINGGQPGLANGGSCSGSDCDTRGLVVELNDALHCGASGWRLPTREELNSLVHAGRRDPALAVELFPLGTGPYWSSTPMAADTGSAWLVDFSDGRAGVSLKTAPLKLRLVREVD